jgi:aryl-alcohol dehydrogenase-like predicted oxidoreductase
VISTSSVPNLIYGCMGLGGDAEPPTVADIDRALVAVEAALSMGITWFDPADIYASGRAETVFGEVLARSPRLREQLTLARSDAVSRVLDVDRSRDLG